MSWDYDDEPRFHREQADAARDRLRAAIWGKKNVMPDALFVRRLHGACVALALSTLHRSRVRT